jgi:hypothetical protein
MKEYTLDSGVLYGGGKVDGKLTSRATVVVGSDPNQLTLQVTGDYKQTSDGTLLVNASADASWGLLQVAGQASLDGTVSLALLGGYVPRRGNPYTFLTFGSQQGAFATAPPMWTIAYPAGQNKATLTM